MAGTLLLGPVLFRDFELPGRIEWGGRQRLSIHHLPGGQRVIDAMGRDDAAIAWSGTFSGEDGAARARLIDLMRAEGTAWPLSWGRFLYTVVVQSFSVSYERANWMPYRISCAVLRDEAEGLVAQVAGLAQSVGADLLAAAGFGLDTSVAQSALAAPDATRLGSAAYDGAQAGVGQLSASAAQGFATADAAAAADVPLASAGTVAGGLAMAAFGSAYAGRAAVLLQGAAP